MSNFDEMSAIKDVVNMQVDECSFLKYYNAYTLSDVYDIVGVIFKKIEDLKIGQPLWFRGQGHEYYNLTPSLFRKKTAKPNDEKTYTSLSLMADYRFQNFNSRVNHLVNTSPESRIEWQELYQHHFGSTLLMDWSESVQIGLDFALEAYIDSNQNQRRYDLDKLTPNLWVLNPMALNKKVYDFFAYPQNIDFIKKALNEFNYDEKTLKSEAEKIQKDMEKNFGIYGQVSSEGKLDIVIDELISICTLDKHRNMLSSNLKRLVESREFNPFFYLLLRFYADSLPVEVGPYKNTLPPLAALQPYHSERIRAQRGAFTIFPNYFMDSEAQQMDAINMNILSVEMQKKLTDCFYCIRLCDPITIVKDLMRCGERRTELYPDVQSYAEQLETKSFNI